MNQPLEVKDLVKCYGSFKAVDKVNFHVKQGEIFGLLGLNGAGKTSIISCIVGLNQADQGSINVFGKDTKQDENFTKSQIGFVPQELIHHGYFNIIDIVTFYAGYFGYIKNEKRIETVLKSLDLWDKRHQKVKQLSGGMKRRVLIAKALSHHPKIVLLDEPTAGLDVELTRSLWNLFIKLKNEGVSILLTTHYLREAERLCDRVAILDQGKIREEGPTKEVVEKMTQRKVSLFFKKDQNINSSFFVKKEKGADIFQIPYNLPIGDFLSKFDMNQIDNVKIEEGTLENAFEKIIESKNNA